MSVVINTMSRAVAAKMAAEITGHYDMAYRSLLEADYLTSIDSMEAEIGEALAKLRRYRAFGGDNALLMEVLLNVPLHKAAGAFESNIKLNRAEVEHLGSSPMDPMRPQGVLQSFIEVDEILLELCRTVGAGTNKPSASLAKAQDAAQDAFDEAVETFTACVSTTLETTAEGWRNCEMRSRVAFSRLNDICKRLNEGEVPARHYPLSTARWESIENAISAVQESRDLAEKAYRAGTAGETEKCRFEACRTTSFMFTALFNVRRASQMQQAV